jgi:hypothetical protein
MNPRFLVSRKRLLLFLPLTSVLLLYFSMFTPSLAQDSEVREIDNQIPQHLPLTVKLKKEDKIKDLKNEQWVRDFELEVTNTSDKPIYYLEVVLVIPEVISEGGAPIGMPLRYGRMAFVKHDTKPVPEDVPIKPGETYTFKVPEMDQKGWYAHKAIGYMTDPKRIQLVFVHLSFGDGTGFRGTTGVPYPHEKQSLFELKPAALLRERVGVILCCYCRTGSDSDRMQPSNPNNLSNISG